MRLVVPGWYGVASVKWIAGIEAIAKPFHGYFQADKYVYEVKRNDQTFTDPVTLQRVRALITEPAAHDEVPRGDVAVRGVAWSGAAPIARVEVSVGDGPWQQARLVGDRRRHGWQWWELITHLERPGVTALRARATDMAGRSQPDKREWNRLGYGNNAVEELTVCLV